MQHNSIVSFALALNLSPKQSHCDSCHNCHNRVVLLPQPKLVVNCNFNPSFGFVDTYFGCTFPSHALSTKRNRPNFPNNKNKNEITIEKRNPTILSSPQRSPSPYLKRFSNARKALRTFCE